MLIIKCHYAWQQISILSVVCTKTTFHFFLLADLEVGVTIKPIFQTGTIYGVKIFYQHQESSTQYQASRLQQYF